MLFFNDTEVAAHQERFKDLLKEVENQRLINIAQSSYADNQALHVSGAHWLGAKMVEWGYKLQAQPQSAPIRCC
jgi:hypothetical protein